MNIRSFFIRLLTIGLGTGAVLALLHVLVPEARPHGLFAIASLILFMLVCTGLYFAGLSAAKSSNKYAFTNLVSVSVFGKMVLVLAFLFIYQKMALPANQLFVGIFLFCYVVFTAFEVWFMTRLARV